MRKYRLLIEFRHIIFLLLICCQSVFSQVTETTHEFIIDPTKAKIITRFAAPKGYTWVKQERGSFSEYLINFPLHPPGFPIRDFRAVPVENQDNHVAILKIDVGDKDLQQCADAWMRLYAEYLWSQKRFSEIGFEFTSGQFFSWNDYKSGLRTVEAKKRVRFVQTENTADSYQAFRKYLNIIFRYAGTISLNKESRAVPKNSEIKPGDFIIKPGSPGHSVIVVGAVENKSGHRLYLLAESYMPAQDVHILKNLAKPEISPWYELDVDAPQTVTAKYTFKPTSIKRFHAIK